MYANPIKISVSRQWYRRLRALAPTPIVSRIFLRWNLIVTKHHIGKLAFLLAFTRHFESRYPCIQHCRCEMKPSVVALSIYSISFQNFVFSFPQFQQGITCMCSTQCCLSTTTSQRITASKQHAQPSEFQKVNRARAQAELRGESTHRIHRCMYRIYTYT